MARANAILAILLPAFSLYLTDYVMISSGMYVRLSDVVGLKLPLVFAFGRLYYL
ncbi:hypothetical protein KC734_23755 [candidate division KSB1 bacterium]|nr:hypothetical protein [candidate division KSB1 bacterium]